MQEKLAQLLTELQGKRPSWQQRRLERELGVLSDALEEQRAENERLRSRLAHVESGLHLLDQEQLRLATPARLSQRVPLLTASHPLFAAANNSQQQVSVWQLPGPESWDVAWEQRVRGLSSIDMVILRRQFLHEMAMLLPKVQAFGNASKDYMSLQRLMDAYTCFNRNAITLAPEAWVQRSKYNLESLELVEAPSPEMFQQMVNSRQQNVRIKIHFQEYVSASVKLKLEYLALAKRHSDLMGQAGSALMTSEASPSTGHTQHPSGMPHPSHTYHICPASSGRPSNLAGHRCSTPCGAHPGQPSYSSQPRLSGHGPTHLGSVPAGAAAGMQGWSSGACSTSGPHSNDSSTSAIGVYSRAARASSGSSGTGQTGSLVMLQELVSQMDANIWRQRQALKHCLFAAWQAVRDQNIADIAKGYLILYPLPLDAADFLETVVDAQVQAALASTPAAAAVRLAQGQGCSIRELSS